MEQTLAFPTAAASEEKSERRRPPPPRAAPWLVIPHRKGKKDQAFYNLCEPNNRTCRKFIPELSQKSFWQKPCHQGWLVMLCDDDRAEYSTFSNWKYGDCFLWNPLTLETIQLPSLLHWLDKSDQYHILDCVLSSPPTSSTTIINPNDDSMVFFLLEGFYKSLEPVLVFCRPGEDKQWRRKELPGEILDENRVFSLVYFKGMLYVTCMNKEWLLEIEKQLGPDGDVTLSIKSFEIFYDFFILVSRMESSDVQQYYVESSNELFMIDVTSYNPRGYRELVASIEVLRLDFSLMIWEKVQTLGDHVLFFGKNTTASSSATEMGLKRGCLYYTLPEDQSLYKFELEDDATTPILPCLKLPTPWFSASWITMPTTVRVVVDGRRRRREEGMFDKANEEDNFVKVEENKASIITSDVKENQEQKQNGGELDEATTWGILNEDMMELILSYLHPVDYVHFRAVNKANQFKISPVNRRSSSNEVTRTTYLSPWLVFSEGNNSIHHFVDPMHNNEKYLMNLSELLVGATIRCSKGGWLLMSKGRETLFFYNPFTRETIQLPYLEGSWVFTGMSFSSLPTCSDSVVFSIANNPLLYDISIVVIARGDNSWRRYRFENSDLQKYMPCINNPVFYDGAFYCLDYNGALGVSNLEDGINWIVLENPQGHFKDDYPSFLVECDGKLLSVDLGHLGKSVGIFRLDFSKMVWVKVESLGKHMLFISNTSCLSAIAPHSRMENKIFFPRLHDEAILFYSLDTGRYHSLGSRHSANGFYDTTDWGNYAWIEPNWSSATEQELDWLSN